MRSEPARERRAPWAALLCVVGFALTGWSSEARASCGDYVVVINPSAEYLRNRPIGHPMQAADPTCPCQGPQCRRSDSSPPMPASAHVSPEYELEIFGGGELVEITLLGRSRLADCLMRSEAHLLIPDPPPRTLS